MATDDPPPGFLDAASGEPLHPAAQAALDVLGTSAWADPLRLYGAGRRARVLLDEARSSLAERLGCRPDELFFPASGTAAVHLGVAGLALGRRRVGDHVVASAVEHASVLSAIDLLGGSSQRTLVGVDRTGRVDPQAFAAALRPGTALAALQTANHEVGSVQPVEQVAAACEGAGVPLLVDAAQSVGRGPLPTGWSVLTASAHKWGGPAGVGLLAVRTGTRWRSPGAADERGYGTVPGFENVGGVVAAAAALEAVLASEQAESARLRSLTARMREELARAVPDIQVVGHPEERLPHLVTFSCLYVQGEVLLDELDAAGFAVSSGSSCTSAVLEPSHVLAAMGVLTHGNIRVSLPRGVAEPDVERFLRVLPEAVARVRARTGVADL